MSCSLSDFENKLFSFTDQNCDFGSLAFVLFLFIISLFLYSECVEFAGFVASYLC